MNLPGTIRSERIEPCVGDAGVRCVGVLRDEDAARGRRCPQGRCIRNAARDRRDGAAGTRGSAVVSRARSQIRCTGWPDGNEVAASGLANEVVNSGQFVSRNA